MLKKRVEEIRAGSSPTQREIRNLSRYRTHQRPAKHRRRAKARRIKNRISRESRRRNRTCQCGCEVAFTHPVAQAECKTCHRPMQPDTTPVRPIRLDTRSVLRMSQDGAFLFDQRESALCR